MTSNPIQDFFSQIRIPFLGENLLRKYENEKSPLRAEIFTTLQLEQYATSLASLHTIAKGSGTEPLIHRLQENEAILIEVRNLVVESVNENHPTTPAAEWLLDNFYLIEEQIRIGKKHFPKGYSETLPKLSKGPLAGYPRVYSIALEIISHSDGRVDLDNLYAFVNAYQKVTTLNLGELWAIPIMLRLALIENLRRLAAQIAIDRLHKNLADSWADRMIDVAEKDPKSLIVITADMARSDPPMVSSFVAEITRRLLGKGPALTLPLTWIEQRLSENGLTTNSLVHQETQKQAAAQVSISNSIGSLRFLNHTDWRDFVENTSEVERILRQDTNGTYERMDFFTRDHYRHVVERVALRSELPEAQIASIAIDLAKSESSYLHEDPRHQHVGYYLIGPGLRLTEKKAGITLSRLQKFRSSVCSIPFFWYGNSIIILNLGLTALLIHHEYQQGIPTGWLIVAGLIFLFATSYLAAAIVNWIATILIKPDFLPRMNYAYGIPPESKTFVVVPTLFGSIPELEGLIETMEVRYLANRQDNLHFALLTDFKDADYEINDDEKKLLLYADQRIRELNKKYQREYNDVFFLFHRPRKWNEADRIWMGYERKRGKLGDLNALLRGHGDQAFQMIVGDQDILEKVKYIITLDADTQLPRESAWKIVGTIAHPLNQPFFDPHKDRVTAGYGILQPRVATSLPEGAGSWYSRIHASDFGIDPYTRAVSDVYQDVLKEGSFIGKGIYDVDAFERAVGNRFPENRILSHDLLEGCHARSGLTTDVQLYEEYPSAYLVDMKRRHRWIRGDWQIGRWLFPRVPAPGKKTQKNVLSAISRWKIFDNLRRSLVPPAFLLMFLYGWIISDTPWFWTFTVIGIIIPPSIFSFTWNLLNKSKDIEWVNHVTSAVEALINSVLQHIWMIISLPYETHVNLDAIARTLWRMFISKKNLLQWDPFGATTGLKSLPRHIAKMWIGPAAGVSLFLALPLMSWPSFIVASPILILWIVSPVIAWWISIPLARRQTQLSNHQQVFLRKLSRKTWAYFEQFVGPEDNWLPPDNFQEYPSPRIAHRTSPTNMGISLLSSLSAYDFGFISSGQLIERCHQALSSMHNMERFRGHFLNWYDTLTLSPLMPRYVSTVDSGNLAASMLVLKEGLLSLQDDPIIHHKLLDGIQDTLWVLRDKVKDPLVLQKMQRDIQLASANLPLNITSVKTLLEKIITTIQEINANEGHPDESEKDWWLQSFLRQCRGSYQDLMLLCAWKLHTDVPEKFADVVFGDTIIPSLVDIERKTTSLLSRIKTLQDSDLTEDEKIWIRTYEEQVTRAQSAAKTRIDLINSMVSSCYEFADYDYDFLYDKKQHYLTIGYNVDEHRRDPGSYDLLGSEARLGNFVAIAQGKIPQESWFSLGRQVTNPGTEPVLLSWSGSMFEYLMPLLLMPSYENTLLDQTHKGAVRRQIDYGKKRGYPWGISESCFNMVHANMDYQYRAFGVPGLGFKRGLANDYVVAPYATVMALMVEPEESYENLLTLTESGYEGKWGYYESVDFTPGRLHRGQIPAIIKAFMTHHQGMSFLSLAYILLDQPMQKRFQSDLQFQTSLLLLQEKIPQVTAYYAPAADIAEIPTDSIDSELRIINTADTPVPEVQLLSNGRYHVMVTNSGGGYSRWNELAVTRWREDGTRDDWGSFCFIKDLENNQFWSNSYQPTLKTADSYEVIYSQGRAEFRRKDQQLETHTEIIVSPEDDVEMRRIHITNRSRKRRQIEVTSYAEVVLNNNVAEMLHSTFSNLFVQTEILEQQQAIMCTRRPRSENEHPPYMFHLMKVHGAEVQKLSFETSRDQFIGRGNTIADPDAMYEEDGLSGSQGSVLDPIVAIQYKLSLKPYESITLDLVYGIGSTREDCQNLVNKYQDKHLADRAFELAWTHSHVMLRQINATAADAILYCRLAGSIIYANASLRADPSIIMKNHRGQSGLWSHSVSGDWPIVLVQIEDNANIDLVQKLVQAHAFWKLKGLKVDLVIWNEDHGGYRQVLHNQILSLIAPTHTNDIQDKPGGIYIRTAEQLSNEDRLLFQTVARVIISDKLGTLEGQLSRRKRLKPVIPNFSPSKSLMSYTGVLPAHTNLKFFNGLGGFSSDGKEYVITTSPDHTTPAPWSNVLANPHFGTVISESGQSYTWFQNAHELRLTPWNNDPVTDMGGEHFYIRDEESGKYWSPAPLPARGRTPYITRHGFGYSVFEHMEEGIQSELLVFVDPDHPIKYSVLRLKNVSGNNRTLSATGYVEWVLGDLRHKSLMHIVTELDLNSGAIIARNSYQTEFGQLVAFFDVNHPTRTITTDRDEFIGRNGSTITPDAMRKTKLSGKTGAALDPCAVIQVPLTIPDGEEVEIIFRMGTGMHMNDVNFLIRQSRGRTATVEALATVHSYWKKTLSAIVIDSPDAGTNLLTNGWLTYQTLACRLWARSGYYQSGGAFGFRDQLQDVMSLMYAEPALARQQIILCASRQFVQGDVQHWWHPPVGRGVRTKCSDDYLWLPYVTSKYVTITGDVSVLDEQIHFLESRELNKDEDSYYDLPIRSDQVASLYEHCIRALEFGCKFGVHGLPLMGAGDWNDGMDRVGEHDKGESVWLGWFLYDTLQRWIEIAEIKNEDADIVRYRQVSMDLKNNIEEHAWDGAWYRRAYFDDGTPLGSKSNDECKIDSIAQSWSVISKAGDPARSDEALKQANIHLVDVENKIIKLFDPPFDKSSLNPGYIKGYVPGVRENGGQYTHAAIWMIMAFAAKRDKAKMWQLLQMINPIHHAQSPDGVQKYKVEPYVIAADVYAIPNQMGRGGWTWYTGSAGWVYQLVIEYVFGLKKRGNTLTFEPCLPEEWQGAALRYRHGKSNYHIRFEQDLKDGDQISTTLNGERIDDNIIQLQEEGEFEVVINV